jgi:hypothetical protein
MHAGTPTQEPTHPPEGELPLADLLNQLRLRILLHMWKTRQAGRRAKGRQRRGEIEAWQDAQLPPAASD